MEFIVPAHLHRLAVVRHEHLRHSHSLHIESLPVQHPAGGTRMEATLAPTVVTQPNGGKFVPSVFVILRQTYHDARFGRIVAGVAYLRRTHTHPSHLLDGWVRLDHVVERQLVLVVDAVDVTPTRDFPQYEPERVHVGTLERIELVQVDRFVQHLRRHVALGADTVRRRYVDRVGGDDVPHRQPEIADATREVRFDQNVLRLQIAMRDGGFTARTDNVHVQVGQPGRYRVRHLEHRVRIDVASGALFAAGEYLHRHILTTPPAAPHLTEPALADHLHQLYLACDRALHQQRKSSWKAKEKPSELISAMSTPGVFTTYQSPNRTWSSR
uniref:Uncharacterized protein n=1 Tax=Anopheles farauti TaxID=69004 RepID=A0A182Q0H9_9DIPT